MRRQDLVGTKPGKLTNWFIALAAVAAVASGAVAFDRIFDQSNPPATEPLVTEGSNTDAPGATAETSASGSDLGATERSAQREPVPTPFGANRRVGDPTASTTPTAGTDRETGISIVIEEAGPIDQVAEGVEISRAPE